MKTPTGIYTHARQVWDLRLQKCFEHAWLAAAHEQADPVAYLFDAHGVLESAGWQPALECTLPHVPEQFRHLWTLQKARRLMVSALVLATLRLERHLGPEPPGCLMREAILPALENAGLKVKDVSP